MQDLYQLEGSLIKKPTEKGNCADKAEKNQGWETSSCRECDGDLRLVRNTWCLRCEKPIGKVLREVIGGSGETATSSLMALAALEEE